MNVQEIMSQARESMSVKRVFGDPYEKNGVTVIPVAKVMGGGGGGEGNAEMPPAAEGETTTQVAGGSGGGFGVSAAPAGVYVVKGDSVRWLPALDVNRLVIGGQIVSVIFLLVVRSIFRARAKAAKA